MANQSSTGTLRWRRDTSADPEKIRDLAVLRGRPPLEGLNGVVGVLAMLPLESGMHSPQTRCGYCWPVASNSGTLGGERFEVSAGREFRQPPDFLTGLPNARSLLSICAGSGALPPHEDVARRYGL